MARFRKFKKNYTRRSFAGPRFKTMHSKGMNKYQTYRKRNTKEQLTSLVAPNTIMPDRSLVRLKYASVQALQTAFDSNTWKANSLYDPNGLIGGHQPAGFDIWKLFYRRYLVHGCKIKVRLIGTNAAITAASHMALIATPDTTYNLQDPVEIVESPYAKFRFSGNYGQRQELTMYMTTSKMYGRSKNSISAESRFSADITADPADLWYFICTFKTLDGSNFANCYVETELTYYAEFFERKYVLDNTNDNPVAPGDVGLPGATGTADERL